MSLLSLIICSFGFLVILFGLSLICTPFLLRDVHFCMPLWLMLLWVFLLFFIRSLVEVHRNSSKSHGLFFPIFLHSILLYLGLEDFLASELVYIIASIVATFLRQRAAQMKASSKCPRVESSTGTASFFRWPRAEDFVDPIAIVDPSSSSSSDVSLRSMLDTVMTVQAAHGQILVDVLT